MKEVTWAQRLTRLSAAIRMTVREEIMKEQANMLRAGNKEAADSLERLRKALDSRFQDRCA